MTTTLVHGEPADTGCYVEGHWGQYGPDHLADQAEGFGWKPETCLDDPRQIRLIIDHIETCGYPRDHTDMRSEAVGIISSLWEAHTEAADDIETWLNDHTSDGHIWHWTDGEFFLSPWCDDAFDCNDDTCYCKEQG